jgi:excisionase family DNA binding protein
MNSGQLEAFSIKEFCRAYCVGPSFTYELIADKKLRARKVGKKTLILRRDAEAWAAALPEMNAAS